MPKVVAKEDVKVFAGGTVHPEIREAFWKVAKRRYSNNRSRALAQAMADLVAKHEGGHDLDKHLT